MNNKGVSEIVSQILLMLVTVVVVGIIIAAIVPQMSRGKSQIKFEESKLLRDNLFSSIQEVYNSPIGHTKEISLKLENLSLNIDGDTETIEIYSIIDGEFYKDGLRQEEGNGKYTYRRGQKLYAGFTLENIDIVRSYVLENQLNATIYLRKTDKDKITILLENVIEDSWFTASNLGLYDENPSTWQYRKKILIDGKKVDGNLTNFPTLIYLEDEDLNAYAKADGSDIIFTSKDGKTKLKREIESYGVRNEYEYRKKITIDSDKVEEDLTDFPMLVSLLDSDLKTYAQSDGRDIYFTASDGETRLKREIESFEDKNLLRKKITIDKDKVDGDLTDFPMLVSLKDSDLKTYAQNDGRDIYFTASDGTTRLKREIESFQDVNTYRKKITIDKTKVDSNLTDFPMLVSLKDSDLKNYAQSDGRDIYFTTSDGTTRLKREIESFEDINTYRKKITIDKTKVDSNLTDFPILVSLTDANLSTFAQSDGRDIYFTASDGTTRLKREIEDYNSTTGTLIAWVKVPSLSSTVDTNIYMHFGNTDENNTNDKDVWDSNYVLVHHFNNIFDSTIFGNNGTLNNLNFSPGLFGLGLPGENNGTKNMSINHSESLNITEKITIQAIVRFNNLDYNNNTGILYSIANKGAPDQISPHKGWWFRYDNRNNWKAFWYTCFGNTNGGYVGGGNHFGYINKIFENNVFNFILFTIDNNVGYFYINGTLFETKTLNNLDLSNPNFALTIGGVFSGIIDEFRVSNIARPASWIKTEYNNQNSPATFYSVGALETTTTKELIAWVKVPNLSSTVDTNIYMHFGNIDENNTNDTDVWDSNFISVWHKNDFNSTTILDSTTNNITGTKSASPPLQTIGKIGKAQIYNNQHISIGQNKLAPLLNGTTGITVTAWIKPNTLNTEGWILFEYITSTNVIFTMRTHSDKTFSTSGRSGISDGSQQHYSTATLNENEWQYIVIQADYTNTKQNTYYNGIYDNNSTPIWGNTTLVTGTPSSDARIGNHQTAGRNFDGIIDELRVSKIVRSPSWIKTEYNNQSSPETFYSIGELETTTKKELIAWVKIPELSSTTNTDIYMYFGDASENNPNDTDVWDSNYLFVQHFNDNVLDSTINNRNGTINGIPTYVGGIVGKGLQFNGNPDSVTIDYSGDLSGTGNFSVSAWTKYTGSQTYIIVQSHALPPNTYASDWFFPFSSTIFWMRSNLVGNATTINDNNWHQVTMVWDKSIEKYKGYIDGQFIAESNTISGYGGTGTIKIGGRGDLTTTFFIGTIDNIRVSNSIKSSEWIKTEYNNQSSPESFYSVGCVEEVSFDKELIAWVKVPELSSTTDTNIYMYFGNTDENNSNDTDVWDENYMMIQHFNDNLLDSTNHNRNGTNNYGSVFVDKYIGQNIKFDGVDDYTNYPAQKYSEYTLSAWIDGERDQLVGGIVFSDGGSYYRWGLSLESRLICSLNTNEESPVDLICFERYNLTNYPKGFHNIVVTDDGITRKFYKNGELLKTHTNIKTNSGSAQTITIGRGGSTGASRFKGGIDEARISNIARSPLWIKTEYNNQSSPQDFYTTGEMETITTPHTELFAWVKIPELTTGINTPIYMYFGNPSANEINDKDVWDEDYIGIWHKNDLTTSTIKDSTINSNNGTKTAENNPAQILGKIGFAQNYNGVSSKINTNITNISYEKSTISFWANFNNINGAIGNSGIIFGSGYWTANKFSITQHSGDYRIMFTLGPNTYAIIYNAFSETGTWNHYTFSYDSTAESWNDALKIYVNGGTRAINSSLGETLSLISNSNVYISNTNLFSGMLDEIRFSNISRSPSWIKTEYNNQSVPEEFIKVGILEKA